MRCRDFQNMISLQGEWFYRLDPEDQGIQKQWFQNRFAEETLKLPGTLCENGIGKELELEYEMTPETVRSLRAKYAYIGVCWYQKKIHIPKDWDHKRVLLSLERIILTSEVWVDDRYIGKLSSLVGPHGYDLTDAVSAGGEHTLTIRIDNRDSFYLGTYGHSYTDETQTIWNGIVGEICMTAKENVYTDEVMVFTDDDGKQVHIKGLFKNYTQEKLSGQLSFYMREQGRNEIIAEGTGEFVIAEGTSDFGYTLPVDQQITGWSEFTPILYKLSIELHIRDHLDIGSEPHRVVFGFRNMKVDGRDILLNDKKIYLRGNLECCIHPLTGYPPCDVGYWSRICQTVKAYGMNHIRFHSNCPPEAAFIAADQAGVYLQVEGPAWLDNWFMELGSHKEHYTFLPDEAERIIRQYSNHPSFCIFCNGNEFRGDFVLLHHMIARIRAIRPDILYTLTANYDREPDPEDDIFISVEADGKGMRGNRFKEQMAETLRTDYSEAVKTREMPLVAHEGGQYCVYPNTGEIPRLTGNLVPMNLMVIQKDLERKKMLHLSDKLVMASGHLAARLYKEEIESYMRTVDFGGFQLLGIQGFPGQCTATVGLLDSFWRSKQIVSERWFRQFCNAVVPLFKTNQRTFSNRESIYGEIMVAQFSQEDIPHAQVRWEITDGNRQLLAGGSFENIALKAGSQETVGYIRDVSLDSVQEPVQLQLSVAIEDTPYNNTWDLWVFPEMDEEHIQATTRDDEVQVVYEWNGGVEEMLRNGSKVLLIPKKESFSHTMVYPGAFYPAFWSPVFFKGKNPCGIYCNAHASLRYFPTDHFSHYQWYHLLENSFHFSIDHLGKDFTPIIEVIPNYYENHRMTNLLEARVGQGILLICTIQLDAMQEKNEAKWFQYSLLWYLSKGDRSQVQELGMEQIRRIFYGEDTQEEEKKEESTENFIG